MKSTFPWVIAVLVLYAIVVIVVFWAAPFPWDWIAALFVTLMAVKFFFLIRKVGDIGHKRSLK